MIPSVFHETFTENYWDDLALQSVPLVYSRQSYSGHDSGLHLHEDHYALYVVNGGRGVHEINGHPYGVTRGDVYLTPPGSIHAYRNFQDLEVDVFIFQAELFSLEESISLRALPGFRGLFLDSLPANASREEQKHWKDYRLHLAPEKWRAVENQTLEVRKELERATVEYSTLFPEAALLARVLFFRLLTTLARLWKESIHSDELTTYRNVEIAEVLRFCEAHFEEPISVPQMAAKMFLSPSRFSEIFKTEMGVPPGEYLRRLRLDRAQSLLKTSRLDVGEIAGRCGFSDAAHFSRAFKSTFGKTPSEYRKHFSRTHN